ncbi:MAG: pyridoxal phosphate-dependent aminotransferase [Acidobacteria bacterium]|nr:pyridoxal phosphate-dependent aminotransferase [Acidobacteriota bacterium]MBI3280127.1 pyridoxal phosphate-dependent aminotransferase [Acidobacteriota bacterium]
MSPAGAIAVSRRVSLLQPTAVNSILKEVRELQAQGRDIASLMRGEPDFRTPGHIVEAAQRALAAGRTGYPDNRGEPALRRAVAEKLERENGLRFDPEFEILITTGATFGIYAALAALIDGGGEVLLPDPIYDAYQSPIRLAGGRVRPVRARLEGGRFRIPREALEEAWTPAAKLLLLNTPWNPVGTVLGDTELREIGEFVLAKNLLLISDEIYEAITYDGARHLSPAALSPELRARCVVLNSFSKTYAMTGWRAGYCAAPREIIAAMYLVLQQSSRGPATFVQDAAAAALGGPQDCVAAMRREYAGRRAQVLDALGGLRGVRPIAPEGGFFAMADVRGLGRSSDAVRRALLLDHGVVVVHGSAYGAGGEGTLRISFASGGETLARGLEHLRAGLAEL